MKWTLFILCPKAWLRTGQRHYDENRKQYLMFKEYIPLFEGFLTYGGNVRT